jgi:ATP-dependent helicase HrpB
LENGRRVRVHYERQAEIRPIIEIIIQRIFGCFTTPVICGKKVLLRLLSPASRPLQVTDDLENFWTGAWVEICKEMKGRYPKHNWNYQQTDPAQ